MQWHERTHGTNRKGEKWTAMLRGMWNLGSSLSFPSVPSVAFFLSWNGIAFGKIAHAQTKYPRHRKTNIQEPVSSTSGRDAREMYHDISSWDWFRALYFISWVSDTNRSPIQHWARRHGAGRNIGPFTFHPAIYYRSHPRLKAIST